ncbi:hypothetical protein JYU34_007066 [Plutella xylostella]|uniref:Uncharacterized protein n=1 Tax=Plutella xylostella TaxID=51655 RepID=A0ABQ7QPH9_PLUXY|nr:hypothetical protein JYU34_007066 [Plutella xylostella]
MKNDLGEVPGDRTADLSQELRRSSVHNIGIERLHRHQRQVPLLQRQRRCHIQRREEEGRRR